MLILIVATVAHAGTPQTITFPPVADHTSTDVAFPVVATASSGLPVSYSITSPAGVVTLSGGNVLNLTGTAGAVTVKASQAGNGTFDAAADVYRSFTVTQAALRFVKTGGGTQAEHGAGIRIDGTLWTWGYNHYGQLGDGTTTQRGTPQQVGTATNWATVACGTSHTLAVRSDGTLWAWGDNQYGQLGLGTGAGFPSASSVPVQVGTATSWTTVVCGEYSSLAILSDGTLWGWGGNFWNELGDGTSTTRREPVQIGTATNWASVSMGRFHTAATRTDGTLWTWGFNPYGALGDTHERLVPGQVGPAGSVWTRVVCGASHTLALRSDGTLWGCGDNFWGQLGINRYLGDHSVSVLTQVGTATDWASVSTGFFHSVGVRTNGTLWTWGGNFAGELGTGDKTFLNYPTQLGTATDWVSALAGKFHTLALRTSGSLWSWGNNTHGQLGTGGSDSSATPLQAGTDTTWTAVARGNEHSVALRGDGTLWAWGHNELGQLGDGTTMNRSQPVQIGTATNWTAIASRNNHTLALRSDGTLWAWGDNGTGQLGTGTQDRAASPVQVGTETTWTAIACGESHSLGVKMNGTLWAWGSNIYGKLGNGVSERTLVPVQVGIATNWFKVSCGEQHTLATRTNGTLWSWGRNYYGQLGDGTTTDRGEPAQIGTATTWSTFAGGSNHSLAVRTDGTLWAWGYNGAGSLGDGTNTNRLTPAPVGTETTWTRVAAGATHSAGLRTDGSLWTWGTNRVGQLGHGTMVETSTPAKFAGGGSWTQVAADYDHILALRADGTLWAAGFIFERSSNFSPARVWPDRAAQTVPFPGPDSLSQGQQVWLPATASSGLPITYAVEGSATLAGEGRRLLPGAPGSVTLQARQDGDEAWLPATPVTRTLEVQAAPVATMSGNGQIIARGDQLPDLADHTDFGTVATQGDARTRTFTITNTGSLELTLDSPYLWGTHAADFSFASLPAASLAPGASTSFQITLDPTAPGLRQGGFGIITNEGGVVILPLFFGIQGTGVSHLINLPPIGDHLTTDAPFALGGTTTSGLPITYTVFSSMPGMATVTNGVLTFSGAPGSVTIVASQPGNGSFEPAAEVRHTFRVIDPQQAFVKLAAGSLASHGAGIRANGTLWTWGNNSSSQLGHSGNAMMQVGGNTNWTAVACGQQHTVALQANGTLWSWGGGSTGQLGHGNTQGQTQPKQIGTGTTWTAVACGLTHTLALQSDGSLWAWGSNIAGEIGDNTTSTRSAPVKIAAGSSWTAIAGGWNFSLALRADGTLWAWGGNNQGQLGDASYTTRLAPVKVGSATTWTAISVGRHHSTALRADGTLWTWGGNPYGQLGFDIVPTGAPYPQEMDPGERWTHVACGLSHTVARRTDGTLWSWGKNSLAELGDGTTIDRKYPVQVGTGAWDTVLDRNVALRPDGSLWSWGLQSSSPAALANSNNNSSVLSPAMVGSGLDWATVSSGGACTAAVRRDGSLWTWGPAPGLGSSSSQSLPARLGTATDWTSTSCGSKHAAALRADGSLWLWGQNTYGQLGDGSYDNRLSPVQAGVGSHWVAVACGDDHTLALRSDGSLWACGSNYVGQLGIGSAQSSVNGLTRVGTASDWAAIRCGADFSAALRTDGTLWTWGNNSYGNLGIGSADGLPRNSPVQVGTATDWTTFSCGTFHMIATRANGTLWGWGFAAFGQLGEVSDFQLFAPEQLGTSTQWASALAGFDSSLAFRKDGSLWGAGNNSNGQFGNGETDSYYSFEQINPAPLWTTFSTDGYRTTAVRADGSLWVWGARLNLGLWDASVPAQASPPRAAQAVGSFSLPDLIIGVPVTLNVSASSGLALTLTVIGPATLAGNVLTATGPGRVSVTAYQFGDAAWQPLVPVTASKTAHVHVDSHQETWRQTHFGSTANTGTAADTFDADHDGLANLIEYAFGLSPVAGTSMQLPVPQRAGNTFTVSFTEPAGVTGVTYGASYSTTLGSAGWTPIPDTGSGTTHIFSAPIGVGDTKVFIQLSVRAAP